MICKYCGGDCVKNGYQLNGKQRFRCKDCHRKQQSYYEYHACNASVNDYVIEHIKEGVGIRSLARLLRISTTTLMARILTIAKNVVAPHIISHSVYEVDEIRSFVGKKSDHIWIAYALNRSDKSVTCFTVGPRTNETLNKVLSKLSNAKRIYTDRLRQYNTLIPATIHRTTNCGTNHIERHNLTIRTHLKRLARRTICFSRKITMLYAVLKIYFWG
jgi:IS1 family transposase/transposase-like protein